MRSVSVFIEFRVGIQPQLFTEQINFFFFAGQEYPSRPCVKFLGIRFERRRRISLPDNADGIKKDIFANSITKQLLHLRQSRRLKWTGILTVRVDEIDGDDFSFEQVVIEMNFLSICVVSVVFVKYSAPRCESADTGLMRTNTQPATRNIEQIAILIQFFTCMAQTPYQRKTSW